MALREGHSLAATGGRMPRSTGLHRSSSLLVVSVVLAAGVILAGCSSSPGSGTAPTTAGQTSCGVQPGGQASVVTVPITVSSPSGGKLVTVAVCVGNQGPYPFVADTGTSRSIISSALASSLSLKAVPGRAGRVALGGSGCAASGNLVHVPALHVGTVALAAQDMVSTSLSDWSGTGVDGVLGSDVLGRFAAVKLDLPRRTLSFDGPETAAPSSHTFVRGRSGVPFPPHLLSGNPVVTTPLTLVTAPGTITPYTNATIAGQGPEAMVVATGSPFSALLSLVVPFYKLQPSGMGVAPGGVGCTDSVPVLQSASLELASTSKTVTSLRSVDSGGPLRAGVTGFLGEDWLGSYGTIVVYYAGAEMALANG